MLQMMGFGGLKIFFQKYVPGTREKLHTVVGSEFSVGSPKPTQRETTIPVEKMGPDFSHAVSASNEVA
jgi:hypothetical protein